MNDNVRKKALNNIFKLGEQIREVQDRYEIENDQWWKNLTEQEREDAFYAVVKRIVQAELVEKRSYRGALYDVFGFDAGMYIMGMDCGYMALHNSIVDINELYELQRANSKLKKAIKNLLANEEGAEQLAKSLCDE
jgi:hypothetical protein